VPVSSAVEPVETFFSVISDQSRVK